MSDTLKTFLFAAILCLACSVLLTAASTGLKGYQYRNIAVDKKTNILRAVGLIEEGRKYTAAEVESAYDRQIRNLWVAPDGRIIPEAERGDSDLPIYVFVQGDRTEAYVVPIDSRGLWGKIKGYLALEDDGSTVRGFTVYSHSETPGLGGEIEQSWFRKNFAGKKIVNGAGEFVSISIAKGVVKDVVQESEQMNYVDGISGATLTGKYLTAGLKDILLDYEPVAVRFRKHVETSRVDPPEKTDGS